MKNIENLRIFKRLYDFSAWLLNHTGKFPKSHRFNINAELADNDRT